MIETGASYFGNRTLRHVRADLADMAESGFTYVVHCFTENDLLYARETMRRIVAASHELDLRVYFDPWGVAGIFGGEAFSRFVAREVGACQVLADGTRVGAACLNRPELRAFLQTWIDAAIDLGADVLFWDEPHWYPGDRWFYGERRGDPALRWSCHCDVCCEAFAARFGRPLPTALDDDVAAFRREGVLGLLTDLIGYAHGKGGTNALCLLPHGRFSNLVDIPDWAPFLQIPGLDIFGTDPYWAVPPPVALEPFVRDNAARVRELCDRFGLQDQFWIQGYALPAGHEHEVAEAVAIAVDEGMTNLAVWSYRACEPMSSLWPADGEKVWSVLTTAFRDARAGRLGPRAG